MSQSKLSLVVAEFGHARRLADWLSEAEQPAAHAVTLFEIPGSGGWRVEAYYDSPPDGAAVLEALDGLPATSLQIEDVPDENWVAISQAALPPVQAGRFIVHGSHDRATIGHRLTAIEIDAGEAFGTAHHSTTRGCLEALDRVVRQRHQGRPIRRVLDLGCGSGVLAIAAHRLLPRAIIRASDIDPEAVRVARSNARVNRAARAIRIVAAVGFAHPMLRAARRFDLILANILAGPLIRLAPAMHHALSPRGLVVLSGILAEQSREVEGAYRAQGFQIAEKRIDAGWVTLALVRH